MRSMRARMALVVLLALGAVLAAAAMGSAAPASTGAASISAGDGSLTIDVTSAGNAGDTHGNANFWTSPVDPSGSFYWFNQPVTVTDFAFPDLGNGLPTFQSATISRNIGMGYDAPAVFPDPFTVSEDGVYSISAAGTDDVGSVSGTITPAFGVDMTDPVVTTDRVPFYAGTPQVTVTATDTMSGLENVLFNVDGVKSYAYEPDFADPGVFSVPFSFAGEGEHVFSWVAFDNAGNAARGSETFRIDNTPPTTTSDAVATYNGPATIKLTAHDDAQGAGLGHTYYALDGDTPVDGTTVNVPAPVDGAAAHVLEFWSVDAVGNEETPHTFVQFTVNSQHKITVSWGSNGSISPGTTIVNLNADSPVFQIKPKTGYHITNVLVDGVSKGKPTSYQFHTVIANHTLSASFAINTYTITPSRSNSHGSITPNTAQKVNYGGSKKFTFKAYSHYKISKVLVDGVNKGKPTSYTFSSVKANHTIKVYFVHK